MAENVCFDHNDVTMVFVLSPDVQAQHSEAV